MQLRASRVPVLSGACGPWAQAYIRRLASLVVCFRFFHIWPVSCLISSYFLGYIIELATLQYRRFKNITWSQLILLTALHKSGSKSSNWHFVHLTELVVHTHPAVRTDFPPTVIRTYPHMTQKFIKSVINHRPKPRHTWIELNLMNHKNANSLVNHASLPSDYCDKRASGLNLHALLHFWGLKALVVLNSQMHRNIPWQNEMQVNKIWMHYWKNILYTLGMTGLRPSQQITQLNSINKWLPLDEFKCNKLQYELFSGWLQT